MLSGGLPMLEKSSAAPSLTAAETSLNNSLERLLRWLEDHDYRGYDTFDGLNARFLRPLTFNSPLLRIVLQQGVRQIPAEPAPAGGHYA